MQYELSEVLNGAVPTAADLPSLKYLEMVFNETNRLYPPFWGSLRYSEEPLQMHGYQFPAKSTFLPLRYFAHRHPDFWENPEGFDPERFSDANRSRFNPIAFLPYGAGPRTCLGRHLAPLVCHLVIATVLQEYELHFKPQHPNDPLVAFDFGTLPRDRVIMSLKPRRG